MKILSNSDDLGQLPTSPRHDFLEILVITISAVLSDCDTIEDVTAWSHTHTAWLRQFLALQNGSPSQDTFLRVFSLLDPKQFEYCFRKWTSQLIPNLNSMIEADGKTVHGSGDDKETAIHMVSAFTTGSGLALGHERISSKRNKRTTILDLLEAMCLKGSLVSINATTACQRTIAEKIISKKADYLLRVGDKQPRLHKAIQTAFLDRIDQTAHSKPEEQDHERIVAPRCSILPATGIVLESDWSGCAIVVRIDSAPPATGVKPGIGQRYYIASRDMTSAEISEAIHSTRGIENQFHWILDITMKEDASGFRKNNAPENLSLLKKIILKLLRMDTSDKGKSNLPLKRKRAAWDDELRRNLLGLKPL